MHPPLDVSCTALLMPHACFCSVRRNMHAATVCAFNAAHKDSKQHFFFEVGVWVLQAKTMHVGVGRKPWKTIQGSGAEFWDRTVGFVAPHPDSRGAGWFLKRGGTALVRCCVGPGLAGGRFALPPSFSRGWGRGSAMVLDPPPQIESREGGRQLILEWG